MILTSSYLEEFQQFKIAPYLPPSLSSLDCSGLLDSSLVSAPRGALVGYPGSGNSWIR